MRRNKCKKKLLAFKFVKNKFNKFSAYIIKCYLHFSLYMTRLNLYKYKHYSKKKKIYIV